MSEETHEETFQPRYGRLVWRMHGEVPHLELDSIPLQEGERLLVYTTFGFACLVEIRSKDVKGYAVSYTSVVYGLKPYHGVIKDIAVGSICLAEGRLCSRDLPETYMAAGISGMGRGLDAPNA